MTPEPRQICMNCFCERGQSTGDCPVCGYDNQPNRSRYINAIEAGTILHGNIFIGRVLGQGGFGITYVAKRLTDQKKVAVKEFFPQGMVARKQDGRSISVYTGEKEEYFRYGLGKFLDEAKTLGRLCTVPGVVEAICYFEENKTAYLVMEYIEGISYRNYIAQKGGRIPYTEALPILASMMQVLARVHHTGCIHRDVTPDNIFILKDGRVKLLDFGSARFCLGDRSQSLDIVLKAGYAPPEQYKRRGKQGPYTDVYSLAACLYASITGYIPPDAMKRQEKDTLVTISALGIRIPAALEYAIHKGLAPDAANRYRNMTEFYRDIEPVMAEIQAQKLSAEQTAAGEPEEIEEVTEESKEPDKAVKILMTAGFILIGLTICMIVAYFVLR